MKRSDGECINSDSHQFHQYQQNEQSPFNLTELTEHINPRTYGVGNPGPVIPIFITGFPTAIHILANDEKPAYIRFHSQRSHTIKKKK